MVCSVVLYGVLCSVVWYVVLRCMVCCVVCSVVRCVVCCVVLCLKARIRRLNASVCRHWYNCYQMSQQPSELTAVEPS